MRPGASLSRPEVRYALEEEDRRRLAGGLCTARRCSSPEALGASSCPTGWIRWCWSRGTISRDRGARRARGRDGNLRRPSPVHLRHGERPAKSVVNAFGESHEVSGLFVADMSVFPTSLGAPPQITTAALADRTAHHILERWPDLAV